MQPSNDDVFGNLVQFLLDGNEFEAANVLLSCTLVYSASDIVDPCLPIYWTVFLTCPRASYDVLTNPALPILGQIENSCNAILPAYGARLDAIEVCAGTVKVAPDWHTELLDIARGRDIHNQIAQPVQRIKSWNNLRFRSVSEIRVAQALDMAGVLFLPNCKARLSTSSGRVNREADFLICHSGKWGVLEVDGEPFHPATRTLEDHERDRLFRASGVKVVEHFDASECFENAQGVVSKFLEILKVVSKPQVGLT